MTAQTTSKTILTINRYEYENFHQILNDLGEMLEDVDSSTDNESFNIVNNLYSALDDFLSFVKLEGIDV